LFHRQPVDQGEPWTFSHCRPRVRPPRTAHPFRPSTPRPPWPSWAWAYVGLPTALALLAAGNEVVGIDVSEARLAAVRSGDVDLLPSDHDRLTAHRDDPGFTLTADPAAIQRARTVVVCVPTPVDRHLVPDLNALSAACAAVVAHAVPGQLIMLTSTTYVGTTRELLVEPLTARGFRVGTDVFVAFSPERIDPGNAHHAQDRTPRVAGGTNDLTNRLAEAVLQRTAPAVHLLPSAEQAEMTKPPSPAPSSGCPAPG
jgi:UDP-N-acetyl-D-glucosamine dehydrogenase